MNKRNLTPFKSVGIIVVIGCFCFLYLEQRMTLIKLSYKEAELNSSFEKALVKKEELTYKIASLENPALLEGKLFAFNPDFSLARTVRVVKIPYIQPKVKEKEKKLFRGRISYAEELP